MHSKKILFSITFIMLYTCHVLAQANKYKAFSSINTDRNGGYCFYNSLEKLFPNGIDTSSAGIAAIGLLNNNVDNQDDDYGTDLTNTGIVIVGINLQFNYYDRNALLRYVETGNVALLSGVVFDDQLCDKLNFGVKDYDFKRLMDSTNLLLNAKAILPYKNEAAYTMRKDFVNNYIYTSPSNATILGKTSKYETNFIKIPYGKGVFYIHTAPFSFSNGFILSKENYNYSHFVTSHIPKTLKKVYFDEHDYNYQRSASNINRNNNSSGSNNNNGNGKSSNGDNNNNEQKPPTWWDYINGNPNLKAAFFLSLLAILLAIIFAALRKQRPIKLIPPLKNNSKELVDSISDVYLNQHDNNIIADKKLKYFNETLRNKFNIQNTNYNAEFWDKLQAKTNMNIKDLTLLQSTIYNCNNSANVNNTQLVSLSNQLDKFYKL